MLWIVKGADGGGLSSDVKDQIYTVVKSPFHVFRIADITPNVFDLLIIIYVLSKACGLIVENHDLVSQLNEPVYRMASNEACSTGH